MTTPRLHSVLTVILFACMSNGLAATIHVTDVPGTKNEIQAAVDASQPGDKIIVGPGIYAGAFTFHNLILIGSGPFTVIDEGSALFSGNDAFNVMEAGASGTKISNFTIVGVNGGVFGFGAHDVSVERLVIEDSLFAIGGIAGDGWRVSHNVIRDSFHGIQNEAGNGWRITRNRIVGQKPLEGPPGETHNHSILIGGPASNNFIGFNSIHHAGERPPGYSFVIANGISLLSIGSTMENNRVVGNIIAVNVPGADVNSGVTLADFVQGSFVQNNKVLLNVISARFPIELIPLNLTESNSIRLNFDTDGNRL